MQLVLSRSFNLSFRVSKVRKCFSKWWSHFCNVEFEYRGAISLYETCNHDLNYYWIDVWYTQMFLLKMVLKVFVCCDGCILWVLTLLVYCYYTALSLYPLFLVHVLSLYSYLKIGKDHIMREQYPITYVREGCIYSASRFSK